MALIVPRTLKGFRDFLPTQALERQRILGIIARVYASYGFVPLETPVLEYADILAGKYGDEGERLMYRFPDKGERDVAMRYDLTVPLARVVAQYAELQKPFRRYQIAPVWRAENTQKGRYREFIQCDVDVVGSESPAADADIILAQRQVMRALGIENFLIRVNNRKLLNGILELAGVAEEEWIRALRILDKWDKVGIAGVQEELHGAKLSGDPKKLWSLLPEEDSDESEDIEVWFDRVGEELATTRDGGEGMQELRDVFVLLEAASPNGNLQCKGDPLLARGLDYYTGTVFETVLTDKPEFGSVSGGGRYDNLIAKFIGTDVPAVGSSIGLDRLMAAMEDLGLLQEQTATAVVYLPLLGDELQEDIFTLAEELRSVGIPTEMAYESGKLDKQLKYADKAGIPYVLIFGPKEKEADEVVLKDLVARKQSVIPRTDVVGELPTLLATVGEGE